MRIQPHASPSHAAVIGPRLTALVTGPGQSTVSRSTSDAELWYHLEPMHVLPCVDSRKTIKSLVLSSARAVRWNRLLRKYSRVMTATYAIGLLWRLVGLAAPPSYSGGPLLVLALLFQLPGISATSLSLCYEFLWHAAHTYDFWFFGLMNLAGTVSLVFAYQDVRVFLCLATWIEIENARLADAICASRRMPYIVVVSALCACFFFGMTIAMYTHSLEIHRIVLWQTPRGFQLLNEDIITNSMATLAVLLARLAYRKRNALKRSTSKVVVKCISYRCRLKFQAGPLSPLRTRTSSVITSSQPWEVQIHARIIKQSFNARDRLFKSRLLYIIADSSAGRLWVGLWKVVCVVAVVSWGILLVVTPPIEAEPVTPNYALVGAILVVQVIAIAPILALHQRLLLLRVLTSFDYLFVASQMLLAMVSVCHLFRWSLPMCTCQLCFALGFHVIITADALTPDAKRLLGLRAHYLAVLAICILAIQLFLIADFMLYGHFNVTDRIMFEFPVSGHGESTGQHRVAVSLISFLISRVFTTVLWISQVVWRLWFCESDYDDLILLQGSAEYDYVRVPDRAEASHNSSVASRETST